jgi:predicted nucleotidyltransferase
MARIIEGTLQLIPTPYAELNAVLDSLIRAVRVALGDAFVGAWLQGSFAIGDFDEHSDVDFIVAVRDELTDTEVAALQIVHARIFDLDSEWARHLEGSYFPVALLRDHRLAGSPVWYLDHGSKTLIRSDHCNTAVVRSVVREHGITLAGPPAPTLVDPVPVAVLRREMAEVIRGWGKQILDDPAPYRNRFYQGYIVLSYCRMLHDLVEGRPGSKRAGAEWAQEHLDPKWSALIDRAWGGRPNPAVSSREPPDAGDFESTLAFVRYVMAESPLFA